MFFFYFVLESALLATQRTGPQEYAVRFSRNFGEICENIWKFIDFKCDQIHAHYPFNTTKNTSRLLFLRKHEKFFENWPISITSQFKNKSHIQIPHTSYNKTIPRVSFYSYNISRNEIFSINKLYETSKSNYTDVNKSNEGTHTRKILRYENIPYLIYSYIKKDRKVGFKNSPTFRESDLTQKKILKNLIRIRVKT